jgi:ATP-dependent RNA helicase HelY
MPAEHDSADALGEFRAGYSFVLDDFQARAAQAILDGHGVLVCAPTGAGKTVVGEFAAFLALREGRKCFYTTPIKALSNQKYADLVARHGAGQVGLLTGDNAINSEAPVIVMTTEVLRNMLYAGSDTLAGLGYVVMDEVHYLGDRFRGAVWEEVIIHLPESVQLVSLSATVSNAEEFGDWLVAVRGDTQVIVHEQRPVPLWQHMMVGSRLFDLFAVRAPAAPAGQSGQSGQSAGRPVLDRELVQYLHHRALMLDGGPRRGGHGGGRDGRGGSSPRGWRPPSRPDVVGSLDSAGLLPAIVFVFSRAGCDSAVRQCVVSGLRLIDADQRAEVQRIVDERTATLPDEDLAALGFHDWLDGLLRGVAAHHAGMLPVFKETVEQLFLAGLVRVVFATETLALGINMPARSVVLESLTKFNGETHADITAGEYTQLTGRAGRRGIDVEGHAVVLWRPQIDPEQVGGLASTRTYPLRSSFRPSYNMAVNLVGQMGRESARELLGESFAQFQSDRAVHGLTRQVDRMSRAAAELSREMACDRGDIEEYLALRRQISDRESAQARQGSALRRAAIAQSLESLRPGDIIRVPAGKRSGLAVVLDAGTRMDGDPRPMVLTEGKWAGRLSMIDFPRAAPALGRMSVPRTFNHRSPQARRDLAAALREAAERLPAATARTGRNRGDAGHDGDVAALRAAMRAHPCHDCPDREAHARVAQRRDRLQREIAGLRSRVEGRTLSLARMFDRICALLEELGYLDPESGADRVTDDGRVLARIWSESDLLIAQCLRAGAWVGLAPAELAGVASSVLYESRRDDLPTARAPEGPMGAALRATAAQWSALGDAEEAAGLARSREPDPGFVWAAYSWARGDSLERALRSAGRSGVPMPAGDFVRWCRQVIDLLEQIAAHGSANRAGPGLAASARAAVAALRRGVVAQSLAG